LSKSGFLLIVKLNEKKMSKGLSAKIVYKGEEAVVSIEYMPIELSNFHEGKDLYIIDFYLGKRFKY